MRDRLFAPITIVLPLFLCFCAFLQGCAKSGSDFEPEHGKTTATELKAHLGEPTKIEKDKTSLEEQIFFYENDLSFQIEKDKVTATRRNPEGDEVFLQYWMQKLNRTRKSLKPMPSVSEIEKLFMLIDRNSGVTILYDKTADRVIRIYEYKSIKTTKVKKTSSIKNRFADRKIASASPTSKDPAQCYYSGTSLQVIKKNALKLEAKKAQALGLTTLNGSWRGIDLSTISPLQAFFLKEQGSHLALDLDIDYSACRDVGCILNLIYNNGDERVGWITYWFWMKMGYLIAPSREFFGVENIETRKFFFKPQELEYFYTLSFKLGEEFENLPTLKFIYRVPENYRWADQPEGTGGLYSPGNSTIGFQDRGLLFEKKIISREVFLETYAPKSIDVVIPHELSHALDVYLGFRKYQNYFYDSRKNTDWLDLSWSIQEKISTQTGSLERVWTPTKKNFVTTYSMTEPAEDFAEAMAYYISRPEDFFKADSEKAAYLQKYIFGGRPHSEIPRSPICTENDLLSPSEIDSFQTKSVPASKPTPTPTPAPTATPTPVPTPTPIAKQVEPEPEKSKEQETIPAPPEFFTDTDLINSTHSLVSGCFSVTELEESDRLMQPFTGSDQYVAFPVLTCLNKRFDQMVEKDVSIALLRGLKTEKSISKLAEELKPRYLKALQKQSESEASKEEKFARTKMNQLVSILKQGIKYKDQNVCIDRMTKKVNRALNGIDDDNGTRFYLRFQPNQKWASYVIEEVCLP